MARKPPRHRHSDLKAGVARSVRLLGGVALSKLGTAFEGKGWPDLYLAWRSPSGDAEWQGWIEVKVGRDQVRGEQSERMEALAASGAAAWVLHEDEGGSQRVLRADGRLAAELSEPADEPRGTLELLRVLARLSEAARRP